MSRPRYNQISPVYSFQQEDFIKSIIGHLCEKYSKVSTKEDACEYSHSGNQVSSMIVFLGSHFLTRTQMIPPTIFTTVYLPAFLIGACL